VDKLAIAYKNTPIRTTQFWILRAILVSCFGTGLLKSLEEKNGISGLSNGSSRMDAVKQDSKVSLLNGPLFDAGKRCGLEKCRKDKHDVGRSLLFRCSGGCGGLEYHCCKEQQIAHWKIHKQFCRLNLRK